MVGQFPPAPIAALPEEAPDRLQYGKRDVLVLRELLHQLQILEREVHLQARPPIAAERRQRQLIVEDTVLCGALLQRRAQQIDRHPGLGIENRFGIPDCPERVHWENDFATEVGAPGAYDYGPERCSWLTHHITNWMGDDGFLVRAESKIRRHNPEGDLLFIKGKVTKKYEQDGAALVEIAQEAHQQDDELSILGNAVVRLPKKPG